MPAEIVEFDPATQLASIQPLYMPRHNGVPVKLPVLEEVPVHFDHGNAGGMTYPIQPGDRVMLRPQMRSTELFHTTGEHVASDSRSVSLSDMEAFYDGGLSMVEPIPNFDPDNANWRYDELGEFGWFGSRDGRTKCQLAPGELIDTLAQLAEACAENTTLVLGGSSSGTHQHTSIPLFNKIAATLRAMQLS